MFVCIRPYICTKEISYYKESGQCSVHRYSCTPGFCSQNDGLDRADVLGCLDFCYLDVDLDESLHLSDLNTRYDQWRGTGTTIDVKNVGPKNKKTLKARFL